MALYSIYCYTCSSQMLLPSLITFQRLSITRKRKHKVKYTTHSLQHISVLSMDQSKYSQLLTPTEHSIHLQRENEPHMCTYVYFHPHRPCTGKTTGSPVSIGSIGINSIRYLLHAHIQGCRKVAKNSQPQIKLLFKGHTSNLL